MSQGHEPHRVLNVFLLTMINIATMTLSAGNWPLTAEYGFSSICILLLAVFLFFLPVSLVTAELATGWPEKGGVFAWVREAFGHKVGFLAVWLLWVENIIWYPTILSFMAGSLAFALNPELATNKLYTYMVILGAFLLSTFFNLRGVRTSGWISSMGVMFGTLLPGVLIIVLGLAWLFSGNPTQITFSWDTFFPRFEHVNELALLTGVLLGFSGMEMPAVHARHVKDPHWSYPRAIFLSAGVIGMFTIFGTLAVAMVIPREEINLIAGGMEAISYFLHSYHLGWLVPLVAILVAFGAFGGLSAWTAGPSKGLLEAAEPGDLPAFFYSTNKKGVPVAMMAIQGVLVAILSAAFLFMPDVNSSFWMLTALAAQVYLIMYVIMFATAIVLRYKKPDQLRPYKIPGGKIGMWLVAGVGLVVSTAALLFGFLPPPQIDTGNLLFFEAFLVLGLALICYVPFFILGRRRKTAEIPSPAV